MDATNASTVNVKAISPWKMVLVALVESVSTVCVPLRRNVRTRTLAAIRATQGLAFLSSTHLFVCALKDIRVIFAMNPYVERWFAAIVKNA